MYTNIQHSNVIYRRMKYKLSIQRILHLVLSPSSADDIDENTFNISVNAIVLNCSP